jgi:Fur family ferric uptake transcriptional regulator
MAIARVIENQDRPLSVDEILRLAREHVPGLNLATVYRNLKRLAREGAAVRVDHPALGTLYERSGKGHRHYFHCRVCDHVLALPGCAVDEESCAPKGFKVESHELLLSGVCVECAET